MKIDENSPTATRSFSALRRCEFPCKKVKYLLESGDDFTQHMKIMAVFAVVSPDPIHQTGSFKDKRIFLKMS